MFQNQAPATINNGWRNVVRQSRAISQIAVPIATIEAQP